LNANLNYNFAAGKTFALLGDDDGKRGVGLIPCNLSWLYRCIKELNETQNRRITVSVSSLEVYGTSEKLRDLLASYCEGNGQFQN